MVYHAGETPAHPIFFLLTKPTAGRPRLSRGPTDCEQGFLLAPWLMVSQQVLVLPISGSSPLAPENNKPEIKKGGLHGNKSIKFLDVS